MGSHLLLRMRVEQPSECMKCKAFTLEIILVLINQLEWLTFLQNALLVLCVLLDKYVGTVGVLQHALAENVLEPSGRLCYHCILRINSRTALRSLK